MSFSGFIDVAIGLMLMYFVLSLICTTVNELIATSLRWRAEALSAAITSIIEDPALLKAFYGNGLIANAKVASRGGDGTEAGAFASVKALIDRYCPASWRDAPAAQTATDVIAVGGPAEPGPPARGETTPSGQPKDPDHPSYLDGRTFAMALLQSLGPLAAEDPVGTIRKTVTGLPSSKMRDVLLASIATASTDLSSLRDEIGKWFDTTMDRLSGDYKRDMKRLSLIVGLIVAIVFNADSISVAKALWADETLRAQLVNAAQTTVQNANAQDKCEQTNPGEATKCLLGKLQGQEQQLRPFPIGWGSPAAGTSGWSLIFKPIGWVWTALALSLGAPFWFDLLQKIMNIRGTGPKPETTEKKTKNEKGS